MLELSPVINGRTGALFAVEAQPSQQGGALDLGESAQQLGQAIAALAAFSEGAQTRLIWHLNLNPSSCDNAWPLVPIRELLVGAGLEPNRLIYTLISDSFALQQEPALGCIAKLREQGHLIAVQDQTLCHLGLELLYEQAPELIVIDPSLTKGLDHAQKKRLVLTHQVRLAQSLGVKVWAQGIETEAVLRICQDVGCDLVSGRLLADAETDLGQLALSYPKVVDKRKMRRRGDADPEIVRAQLERLPSLPIDAPMQRVFDLFRQHVEHSYFPIVAADDRPLGLLQERDIKRFIYSSYGRELLANPALKKTISDFLTHCPIVDINSSAELILEVYAATDHPPGVIITEDGVYYGFLSQGALLHLIEQQNLAKAREQNPLTGLPGNRQILQYITRIIARTNCNRALIYFDFDHFKPFNDRYGFRHGDRVIQLFGDLLRKTLLTETAFIGHIGGDDFFAGLEQTEDAKVIQIAEKLLGDFAHSAESLYEPIDRERGYIEAPTRADSTTRRLPLLRCSAAVLLLPAGAENSGEIETITRRMAKLKKAAKASASGIATESL